MNQATIFEDILGRRNWGHRPALLGAHACDYGALLAAVEELAGEFRALAGPRGVVGLCVPPSPAYAAALLAAYAADVVLAPMNPSASADEKKHVLDNAGARAFVTDLPREKIPFADASPERIWRELRLIALTPADPAAAEAGDRFLVYTSGSSTRPKAAILTDAAISDNVRAIADNMALSPGDRSIVFTPPGYTYAMSQTLTHLWAGGATVQYPHGVMYPAEILKLIESCRLTGLACNPTFMRIFLGVRLSSAADLSSVRYVKSAGQPLHADLAQKISRLLPNARMLCTYGCTENSPRVCHHWLPPDLPARDLPWPVGWPLRGTEVKIADAAGAPLPAGTAGEIFIRGGSLMRGYWREPELTAERMRDGWFRTGDLGVFDCGGALDVLGRADNIIGVGHEKVAPEEIEAIIAAVPGVVEIAVGGIPDPLLDRVPIALLATHEEPDQVIRRAQSACREKLAPAKLPRYFHVVEQIPKTPYGKHDRKAIRVLVERLFPLR
jgi:acyl-CoA synthetase (AMP-forming)/AMP-acid ligase II